MESERRRVLSQKETGEDTTNGHPYVEIGGIKWATMNIGAETEIDYGLYFQWGDTAGYTGEQCGTSGTTYAKPFYCADYKFNGGRTTNNATGMTKYNASDGKTVLEPCDDAATLYWGGDWRMPTTEEFQALGAATTSAWTQVNGVSGRMLTDKTDSTKTLFFPAAGYCINGGFGNGGVFCRYWSSSLNSSNVQNVYYMDLGNSYVTWQTNAARFFGLSVRPVLDTSE